MSSPALIDDVVALLAADARQRRERALARGGPARGWLSLPDVAAALDALAASGAVRPREIGAMRRHVRGQISRADVAGAPSAPPELGLVAGLPARFEPGAVEPVFGDRAPGTLERVLIAPARSDGGVRFCSVECYSDRVLARYLVDPERFDPGLSASTYTIVAEQAGEESTPPLLLPPGSLSDDVGTLYRFRLGGEREMSWEPGVPPGARRLRLNLGRLEVDLPLGREPARPSPAPTRDLSVGEAVDRHLWRRLLLLWRWREYEPRRVRSRLEDTLRAMVELGLLDASAARAWTGRIERATARRRRSRAGGGDAHLADLVEHVRAADRSQFASEVVRLLAAAGTLELAGLVSPRSAADARDAAWSESPAREPRQPDARIREPGELRRVIAGPRRRTGGLRVTSVEVYDAGLHVHLHHDGALDPPRLARPWPAVLDPFPDIPVPAFADDRGTRYANTDMSMRPLGLELDDVWNGTLTAQPAPPSSARRLTVTSADRTIEVRL